MTDVTSVPSGKRNLHHRYLFLSALRIRLRGKLGLQGDDVIADNVRELGVLIAQALVVRHRVEQLQDCARAGWD